MALEHSDHPDCQQGKVPCKRHGTKGQCWNGVCHFILSIHELLCLPRTPTHPKSKILYTWPSKRLPFAVWSRLSIKWLHECSYDRANVKTMKRVLVNGAKTIRSHCRTIVETERNINFLLAATVGSKHSRVTITATTCILRRLRLFWFWAARYIGCHMVGYP